MTSDYDELWQSRRRKRISATKFITGLAIGTVLTLIVIGWLQ